jgi:hypothetical protein
LSHILYLSILLVMRLSTFNGPLLIWISIIIFMSNEFNPPYNTLHEKPFSWLQPGRIGSFLKFDVFYLAISGWKSSKAEVKAIAAKKWL